MTNKNAYHNQNYRIIKLLVSFNHLWSEIMQVRYIISILLLALLCGFLVTACNGPPDDAIMDAEDAIKAAANAGADSESPKLLDRARGLLQEAKMLSEQGNYKDARKKAEVAVIQADKAKKNAERSSGVVVPSEEAPITEAPAVEAPEIPIEEAPIEEPAGGEQTE